MGNINDSLQKYSKLDETFRKLTKWEGPVYVIEDGHRLCVPVVANACAWMDSAVLLIGKSDTWSVDFESSSIEVAGFNFRGMYGSDWALNDAQMVFEFLRTVAMLGASNALFRNWLDETEYEGSTGSVRKFSYAGSGTNVNDVPWFKMDVIKWDSVTAGSMTFLVVDDELKVKFKPVE